MTESNVPAPIPEPNSEFKLVRPDANDETLDILDPKKFAHLKTVAEVFAKSNLVPDHYKGNVSDCLIGLDMAVRLRVHPLMMLQNTYVVHARPGIEAKLATALLNGSGLIKGRIHYELRGEGMERECTAWVIDSSSGERVEETVTRKMARAEGWDSSKISKWNTMPDLMLQYRSAMFLIRLHYSEVILGMQSIDEIRDVRGQVIEVEARPSFNAESVETKGDLLARRLDDPVDGTKSEPDPPDRPTEPEPEPASKGIGAPRARELAKALADKCDCSLLAAKKKLTNFCENIFQSSVPDIDEAQAKNVDSLIATGGIVVLKETDGA